MSKHTTTAACLLFGLIWLLAARTSSAQNADLMLSIAERDSMLAEYDNFLPFLGKQAIERGFDIPFPIGVNLSALQINQDIEISDLQLSLNDGELIDMDDLIQFELAKSSVTTTNTRIDAWLLPFLNVYGLFGRMWANTEVTLAEPIQFTTNADLVGTYYGVGITSAIGIKKNWLSFDINWAWSDLDKLEKPAKARVMGIRFGRAFDLGGTKKLAVWVGTMNQSLVADTKGSIDLSEVLPPDFGDQLGDYQNSDWYMNLGPVRKVFVDKIAERLAAGDPGGTTINYGLKKKPADPWNMIAGANFELNKHWMVRTELGFIGRFSALLNFNYRFGL